MPKFTVRRTSAHYMDEKPPIPGATREQCLRVDRRTFKTPEEHDRKGFPNPWLNKGKNHRITDAGIERDFDHEAWFIDIPDLATLMALADTEGELVICPMPEAPVKGFPCIEVYDDYRE